jgi:hypothetical protein
MVLEMLEEEGNAIRQLGKWNLSMQDSCYSTKLPMRPIRKVAGFMHANGMHYNPTPHICGGSREACEAHSPIGRWAILALTNVESAISDLGLPKFTAYNVLKFMVKLNHTFLQDAAIVMIKHPKRIINPLFRLEVFQTDKFQVSQAILHVVVVIC